MVKYCYVFYVTHKYLVTVDSDGDDINEVHEIGVYSSRQLAQRAIQRFSTLPGFSSYPEGFVIEKECCYFSTSDNKADLFYLYSPYYEEYLAEEDCDYIKRGKFFEAKSEAEAVIEKWKKSSHSAHKNGEYAAIEYILDKDIRLWSEGFSKGDE